MPTYNNTYRYHFKKGNKIDTGITSDIDWREAEHQRKWGWGKGHIMQVGLRTTYTNARKWELEQGKQGKPIEQNSL